MAAALALLAAGCNRGDDPPAASTPAAGATPVVVGEGTPPPTPTLSPTPPAFATPLPGSTEVASTVKLIDVRTGVAKTLFEDSTQRAGFAAFVDGDVVVSAGNTSLRFHLDGSPVTGAPPATPSCREANGAAEIAGRQYSGVSCGSFSPDRRWMAYMLQTGEVEAGPSGYRVPQHDMWAVNLDTGTTRRLQAGLVHCGGCDARYGPRWSPSSRYVAFAEFGGEQRRFLSDLTGTTRQIANGNEIGDAPEWSSAGDLLVYSTVPHGTGARFEDLVAGTSRDLAIAWPVRFDASGTYLYSPAWAAEPKSGPSTISTTIIEAASGKVVGTYSGAPPAEFLWTGAAAVTRTRGGYLVILQQSTGCAGTAIYIEGVSSHRCVTGGVQGTSTRDGAMVAVARRTGESGPIHGPQLSATSLPRYDIDVVDAATGARRTVATGAASFAPPLMLWNAAGTHLLVLWPHAVGL